MTTVFSRLISISQRYPLARGMASYACIWPLGSLVQQTIQERETYDYWRALRFSLYGCCFVAPTLYTWMTIAGYLFPKPGFRSGLKKALLEQITYTPCAMICFYFFMELLEGGTVKDGCDEVKSKFWPTYRVGAFVWPVLQTFNFTVVPPQNRVPFVSVCSLCWTSFLAYMKQLESRRLHTEMAIVEQFTYGPFAVASFYIGMTLLEGGSIDAAINETKLKFLPTWQVGFCVWPAVQTINFTMIPERNRIPFVGLCSLLWTTFLAYMKQRQEKRESVSVELK